MTDLYNQLVGAPVTDFFKLAPVVYDDGKLSAGDENADVQLNDLTVFRNTLGAACSAMEVLVAIRNAVAHPDVSKVHPVNRREYLIGFRFDCARPGETSCQQWPKGTQFSISLDRHGMTQIAQTLATAYCNAFVDASPRVQAQAAEIEEA